MTIKKRKTATVHSKGTATKPASGSKRRPRTTKQRRGEVENPPSKPKTKRALIRSLLERPDGASISELMKVTGWQGHSVRAALTGLRHDNCTIARTKVEDGPSRFRIQTS